MPCSTLGFKVLMQECLGEFLLPLLYNHIRLLLLHHRAGEVLLLSILKADKLYRSRVSRQRRKDSVKIERGHKILQKNDGARVQSSQAFSDLWDFRLFGRTNNSHTRDAQIQIINALRLGQRHRAQEMLVDLSCMNDSSNAEDFDYILEYCAQTPDPLFVMEAWKVMVKNEIDMKKKSYRCIIQAFSKGGYFKEAFEWITSLEESGHFHAGLPLYNIVLRECIFQQSMIDVGRCLELMDNQLVGRSEITYWELLKHSVLQKSLSAVHGLWKDCIKHYTPSIIILRKFIWSFTRLHDLESAYEVLQYMVSLVKSSCTSLRKSAVGRYQSSRLDIPVPPACKLSDACFRSVEDPPFQTIFNAKLSKEEEGLMTLDISGIAGCCSNSVADDLLTDGDTTDACFVPNTADAIFSGIHGSKLFCEAKEKGTCSKISSSVSAGIDNRYLLVKNEEMIKHTVNCLQKKNLDYSLRKEAEFTPAVNVLRWSFNDVIQYCAQSGTWELAEFLFLQMQALGVEPSPHTYDGLIKAVTHGRALAYGLELIYSMERRGMKPYNDTIAFLSVEHSKILELNKAECLLEMISDNLQKYIHPFNAFLVSCDIMDEPERAVRILVKMKCLNIRPNIRTFELLFSLFGNVNAPYERGSWPSHMHAAERIRHIEMGMRRNGVQHSCTSMKNLIRALGMEGMIAEMLQRLEKAEKMLLEMEPHQITDLYNIILRALVENGHGLIAIEYFQKMRSYGFPIDAATYHIMIECCSLFTCFRSALALTSLMLRDGFLPQIMTYTALVKVLLAIDDLHGALDIFNQASSDEIQFDAHLFNEILKQAYTKISSQEAEEEYAEGLIDVIEIIIEQMRRDKVKPDPSTCTYAFCAYTELGFHSTAMEALRVLSLRMISENDDELHEQRNSFGDLIFSEDPDVESKIVSIFKGGNEYLAAGLLNLRWCTFMAGHPLSWSPEESSWAQRLSSSYFSRRRDSVHFLS